MKDELDHFVLARLEHEGWAPAAEADPRTLMKRVTLDLTGLLPTLDAVECFAADPSPAAYAAYVDQLLASPAHAEHLTRHWLDAARYGDTHGLHLDNYREMWPYRDWVLHAFLENYSYERFGTEQIAGDRLPEPTLDQQVATGFLRCHVTTNEGGSIEEEVGARNLIDRTSTFGTVFLGLTMGCAQCHDHKFDPISMRDFYGLAAFFDNVDGSPMDGNVKDHAPIARVPNAGQLADATRLELEAAAVEQELQAALRSIEYCEPELSAEATRTLTTMWIDDALPEGAVVEGRAFRFEASGSAPVYAGLRAIRLQAQGLQQVVLRSADRKLRVAAGDRLFASVYLDPANPPREIMLQWNGDGAGDWSHRAYWGEDLIAWGELATSSRRAQGELPVPGTWVRLEVDAQAVGFAPGSVIHGLALTHFDGLAHWDAIGIESTAPQRAEDRVWIDDTAPMGAHLQGDGVSWSWVPKSAAPVRSGALSLRRQAKGLSQDFFTQAAEPLLLHPGDRLFAYVYLDPTDPPRAIQLQFHDGNGWEHRVRWGAAAHGAGRAAGADYRAGDLPAAGTWVRLEAAISDVELKPGMRIDGWAFTQVGGTVSWDGAGVHSWAHPDPRIAVSFLAWQSSAHADPALPADLRTLLARESSTHDAADSQRLLDYYLRYVHGPSRAAFEPLLARASSLARAIETNRNAQPTTLVMRERASLTPTYLLKRGQYDQRGEVMTRATPSSLPPMDREAPLDRLGLARWLFDPQHPFTARVQVNRLWQLVFGLGLVRTSEDFGSQGELPSHRELLDYLARCYIESGWDTRRMLRRFVLSATYRQSSQIEAEKQRRDPQNRLLARGSRFRLDAEVLRDQALQLSGLLVESFGGPSVKPPQPHGLWEAVAYVGSNTMNFAADSTPAQIHRRTLYTFLKRTAPAPQLSTFDAPNRESCVVRRERTNTPMQALLLLNDPQYLEAARALGARVLRECAEDKDAARVAWLFRLALGREPDAFEQEQMLRVLAYETQRPERLSAATPWTAVANLVLNLDELQVRH